MKFVNVLHNGKKKILRKYDRYISQHSEKTLFVLAAAFSLTYIVSLEFRNFLLNVANYGSEGEGVTLIALFLLSIFITIIAAFTPGRVPFFELLTPFFLIAGSLLLTYEYLMNNLQSNILIEYLFAAYHTLIIFSLLVMLSFAITSGNYLSKKYSNPVTPVIDIVTASGIVILVFLISYVFTNWHEISWAIPISLSMTLYQILEAVIGSTIRGKNSR